MTDRVTEHVRSVYSVLSEMPRQPHDLVSRSWIRCINEYGLDPGRVRDPGQVAAAELSERGGRLEGLVACARFEMANLYQQLADTQTTVVLTDADGVLLSVVGEPGYSREAARLGLREGAVWSEQEQGTNGMGTCLVERAPVVIHRDQHFLARNIELTCTAAPIFDGGGRLAAVLDVSSRSPLPQQHSAVLVNMSAQMIENRALLARHQGDYIVRFHSRPEFIYTLHEGELALGQDGRVTAANRNALFQLGFASFEEVAGCEIATLFGTSVVDLATRSAAASFHPVPVYGTRQGARFFAVAQQPERAGRQLRVFTDRRPAGRPEAPQDVRLAQMEFGDARMAHNLRCAQRVLDRDIAILLHGETGTGKEVFAKAIHGASCRASGPFIAVNCASLPESLIESELFGYRSGAFTGASREGRRGKICQSNGGTLFLDEIGDMPLALQARLLRVLEDRMVVPLGGEAPVSVDFRLISATHRDLKEMVAQGQFREDLYYRLQGIVLQLPPLRERGDRRELILHTLAEEAADPDAVSIEPRAMSALEGYAWPGNLRQLRNTLRTALALCDGGVITLADLPAEMRQPGNEPAQGAPPAQEMPQDRLNSLEAAERDALIRELERHRWNISSLAQQLKTSRNTIYRKMKRLDIRGTHGGRSVA